MTQRPNSTHLRHAIDQGRTGDKAPGVDPAVAPLGTDEEAGGAGPTSVEVQQALAAEVSASAGEAPNSVDASITPAGRHADMRGVWMIAAAGVIIAALVIVAIVT